MVITPVTIQAAEVERRRIGAARDIAIDDEDAAADHGADDDGGGAEKAKARDHLRTGFGTSLARRRRGTKLRRRQRRCRAATAAWPFFLPQMGFSHGIQTIESMVRKG